MAELGLFAKHWQPGKVKTRLARSIGDAAAADVYRLMLEVVVDELRGALDSRTIVYAPRAQRQAFAALAGPDWRLEPQSDGDLGRRLSEFVGSALARNEDQCVVLVGSDSPELTGQLVRQAIELLDQFPVVLGPADDGGYYLIAMRHRQPVFQGIPWSTPEVFDATIERLDQFNIPWAQLPLCHDIDTVSNLGGWISRLKHSEFPQTERVLARLMEVLDRHGVDVGAAEARETEGRQ